MHFRPTTALTPDAVAAIVGQVLRWLARTGLIEPDDLYEYSPARTDRLSGQRSVVVAHRRRLAVRKWPGPAARGPEGSVLPRWMGALSTTAGRCPLPTVLSMPSSRRSVTATRPLRSVNRCASVATMGRKQAGVSLRKMSAGKQAADAPGWRAGRWLLARIELRSRSATLAAFGHDGTQSPRASVLPGAPRRGKTTTATDRVQHDPAVLDALSAGAAQLSRRPVLSQKARGADYSACCTYSTTVAIKATTSASSARPYRSGQAGPRPRSSASSSNGCVPPGCAGCAG